MDNQLFQTIVEWLAITSLVTFLLSLLVIPLIIKNLPVHCFLDVSPKTRYNTFSAHRLTVHLLRNIGGLLLLLAGTAMLFLPGQGILTILVGLLLLSFPGKQKTFNFLIHKPAVQRSLDWVRKKSGAHPFIWPEKT